MRDVRVVLWARLEEIKVIVPMPRENGGFSRAWPRMQHLADRSENQFLQFWDVQETLIVFLFLKVYEGNLKFLSQTLLVDIRHPRLQEEKNVKAMWLI